ncbi:MAG: peptidylprolyl isomerase [Lachnospiraceae bacterium]|jgi:peptidyl-prolyl cis-trans isomerase B (cyclophilin B)|nr:peptidylprolyl isomerase [Lachnospiraceae bacterium]
MKRVVCMILIAGLTVMGLAGCGGKTQQTESAGAESLKATENSVAETKEVPEAADTDTGESENSTDQVQASSEDLLSGKHHVEINVKDYGTIKAELDADIAPITVTNFVKLAKEGFYDGLTFHRIISGFMIQGGDPLGNGTGGSDETIKGEFTQNGIENSLSHTRGTISMARSQDMDSASSQFFIVHEDNTFLDGQYAAFGQVTEGMEIVDKICEDTQTEDDNGTVLSENQPVIESITVTD